MKIEAGKFYKTRDGRKVGPAKQECDWFELGAWGYYSDGRCMGTTPGVDDIVSEWPSEPSSPVRTVTETKTVIEFGDYGRVRVCPVVRKGVVCVGINEDKVAYVYALNADELDAAAKVFTDLAAALREMK